MSKKQKFEGYTDISVRIPLEVKAKNLEKAYDKADIKSGKTAKKVEKALKKLLDVYILDIYTDFLEEVE